jgi:DNA-binding NtrC family response regulator
MAAASASITAASGARILVASSRADVRSRVLKSVLTSDTIPMEATGGAEALIRLEEGQFQTIFIDPQLDDLDVDELVSIVRRLYPNLSVVVLDGDESSGTPEDAGKDSAFREDTNVSSASGSQSRSEEVYESERGPSRISESSPAGVEPLPGMIGTSSKMQQIYRLARLVAPRDTAVLIVGATGTGKELVARGIHELSRRNRGPFVVVNCAAIPESLLEAELFGFTRGAFTGAFQARLGRIHAAHGGTLLLDEVGELPLSMLARCAGPCLQRDEGVADFSHAD